ncbi:MAG TPA: GyrI-like domain-containing protein [Candidatus Binatia bacterium]|nr:GyrI-like domain-containing protein [Candidatus Binatia bacterium]
MAVDVTVETVGPIPTAVVATSTTWEQFPKVWGPLLDKVWAFIRGQAPPGLYERGHNVMLYKDDVPNVEVGVQVSRTFKPSGDVVPSTLPGGLVAMARHAGPVARLGETHEAVREWSASHGYRLTGVLWEIYGDPDPASGEFAVDVFWALQLPQPEGLAPTS